MPGSTFYFNPFALISFSSFLIMILLAFLLWHRYYTAQTKFVILLFVVNAIYSLFYALEISFKTIPEISRFYHLEYLGIPFLATYYLMFTLHYSGKSKWLTIRNKLILYVIPLTTLVMVFTNEYHHLFYKEAELNVSGPFPTFSFSPSIWYFVHQGYVILAMTLSLVFLVKMLKSAAPIYRQQIQFLLLASTFPFVGYLVYQLHLIPFRIDPVSFTFTLTGIMVYIALVRFKLFNLVPIARSKLFEKIQDLVLVFDHHNRMIDYNQSACLQFNLSNNDLGKRVTELLGQWPEMTQFLENSESGNLELHNYESGKSHYFNIQTLELDNSKNIKLGKLVVIKDISNLINTEKEFNFTASKLAAVVQAMPDMMFVIDKQGVLTDFFSSDTDNFILNREEVVGVSLHHLFSTEEADYLMLKLGECLISNELITHQYEMNFPGTLKHYEVRLSRLDETHALAIVRDVSESFDMKQNQLYQSGFQKILTSLASRFIYIAEKETDIVINDSLRQIGEYIGIDRCYIFRYDFENKTMTNTHEWCGPGITSLIERRKCIPIDRISDCSFSHQKGEPTMVESLKQFEPLDPIRKALESLDIQSIITIPMISQKNCMGFVGFDNTHTQRQWSDAEISSLKIFTGMLANLQEKITIEQSLVEARIKAEASNRLKTAFMNNISHEIRTPLNGIIGFGEIIANEQLSLDEKNKFLTVVQESSERLIQTIDDYLDISMLVTGNQEIHLKHFNLSRLIEEVIEEFTELCQLKNLTISAEIPVRLKQTTLYSDPELIHKVFNHLVGNAIKFTEKGNICVGLTDEQDHLTIYVKDTGIGIAENAQAYIFDSFMQEDFSSTRMYEESGLGLSIVKGIVILLGGEITLFSTKGKGSTFNITFPIDSKVY